MDPDLYITYGAILAAMGVVFALWALWHDRKLDERERRDWASKHPELPFDPPKSKRARA